MEITINPAEAQTWFSVIPAITALVAVIVTPLITWLVANRQVKIAKQQIDASLEIAQRQIRASTSSAMRRDWVHHLRESLVDLTSTATIACIAISTDAPSEEKQDKFLQTVSEQMSRVLLLTNPDNPKHVELRDSIGPISPAIVALADERKSVGNTDRLDQSIRKMFEGIHTAAHDVINEEWQKIKDGR